MQKERYSFIPIIATILKVAAVLILLLFLYESIAGIIAAAQGWRGGMSPYGPVPPTTGFGQRLTSIIGPIVNLVLGVLLASLAWGLADLFNMVREMTLRGRPETPEITED